jgi:hypothetical protein
MEDSTDEVALSNRVLLGVFPPVSAELRRYAALANPSQMQSEHWPLTCCAGVAAVLLLLFSPTRLDFSRANPSWVPDTVNYQMVKHPESGATLPRIRLSERPATQQKVNKILESTAAELQCSDDRAKERENVEKKDLYYKVRADVTHASGRIFSVAIRINGYCGGPNPWYDFDPLTFDLRSGERLRLPELFVDFKEKQTEIFGLFVSEIRSARQNQLRESGADPSEDPCLQHEIVLERPWEPHSFDFVFVEDGLKVETNLASPRCEVGAVIAYERLQKFASAESVLQGATRGE